MKEITLKIPDKKFRFFMELVENLGFVTVKEVIVEGKGIKLSIEEFKTLCK